MWKRYAKIMVRLILSQVPRLLSERKNYRVTVLTMLTEAVDYFSGERFTVQQIRDYIASAFGEVNTGTINAYITSCTVNRDSRTNWYYNQRERATKEKYDLLYSLGNGWLEKYNPEVHGNWRITYKDGQYVTKKV